MTDNSISQMAELSSDSAAITYLPGGGEHLPTQEQIPEMIPEATADSGNPEKPLDTEVPAQQQQESPPLPQSQAEPQPALAQQPVQTQAGPVGDGGQPSPDELEASIQSADEHDVYRLKRITFRDRELVIICQNVNGPCPLIALCNVLLLRGSIRIHTDYACVTFSFLSNVISDYLLERNLVGRNADANLQYNLNDVIGLMPTLQHGLDVNVRFNGISDFEYTNALLAFDLLNIRLVHGWLVDPQDRKTAAAVGSLSYNQVVEAVIKMHETKEKCEKLKADGKEEPPEEAMSSRATIQTGLLLEEFLNSTAGQLTYAGLHKLHVEVEESETCVLFRNNHFSAMTKYNGELYLLLTDVGYSAEDIVWEKLCEIDGDNVFVNAKFVVPPPKRKSASQSPTQSPPAQAADALSAVLEKALREENDRMIALQMYQQEQALAKQEQEQVDEAYAQQLQQHYNAQNYQMQ